jgi:hypothetical protein
MPDGKCGEAYVGLKVASLDLNKLASKLPASQQTQVALPSEAKEKACTALFASFISNQFLKN